IDGLRELDALIQRMVASDPMQRPQKVRAELRHIQQLHAQILKRTPLWIPPQGQTPPHLLASASPGSPQRQMIALSSSSGTQQQQMVFAPSTPKQQQRQQMPAQAVPGKPQPARKTSRRRVLIGSL